MVLLAVASNRGSPGCTTTALALAAAWPEEREAPLLVEADPDGGVLAARFGLGIRPGLVELCGRARAALAADDLWSFAQELPGGLPVVIAHPAAEPCHAALRAAAARLADCLAGWAGRDAIVDVGRLRPGSPAGALVARADSLLVVVRPTVEDIGAVAQRAALLREAGASLALVGDRPYSVADVTGTVDVPVAGVISDDERAAAALAGGPARGPLMRTMLMRSAAALSRRVLEHVLGGAMGAEHYA